MCGRENVKNNNKAAQARPSVYIYIYIYVCVCVCYIPYGIITTKSKTVYSNEMVSHILEPKWGYNPFAQTFQQNAPVLKLFKKMSLFETRFFKTQVPMKNSIRPKSSYRLKLEKIYMELEFLKLEFHVNFFK